jgi:hypothetical protein
MGTFARAFAITFGVVLGLLAALLLAGAVAIAGYSLYRADQDRRAEEQARARATQVAQERATATTRQAEQQATATTLRTDEERRRAEEAQRQSAAAATATAMRLAARQCRDPSKLVASVTPELVRSAGRLSYHVSGAVRNTCNFDIVFNLDLVALAANGTSIIATKTIAIDAEGIGNAGVRSALIRPGEERLFRAYFTDRPQPDVASVRVSPVIVQEGDPPLQ